MLLELKLAFARSFEKDIFPQGKQDRVCERNTHWKGRECSGFIFSSDIKETIFPCILTKDLLSLISFTPASTKMDLICDQVILEKLFISFKLTHRSLVAAAALLSGWIRHKKRPELLACSLSHGITAVSQGLFSHEPAHTTDAGISPPNFMQGQMNTKEGRKRR